MNYQGLLLSLCILFLLSGCMSMPAVPLKVHLTATKQLNPNRNHKSLPVLVKLFELRDTTSFQQASFYELWKQSNVVLGNSLVSTEEVVVSPNSSKAMRLKREPEAKYLGVVAVFRNPHLGVWRSTVRLPNQAVGLLRPLSIRLIRNTIAVS